MAPSVKQDLLTEFVTLNSIVLESQHAAKGRGANAFRNVLTKICLQISDSATKLAQNITLSGGRPRFHTAVYPRLTHFDPQTLRETILFRLDDIAETIDSLVLQESDEPEFDAVLTQLSIDVSYMSWVLTSEEL